MIKREESEPVLSSGGEMLVSHEDFDEHQQKVENLRKKLSSDPSNNQDNYEQILFAAKQENKGKLQASKLIPEYFKYYPTLNAQTLDCLIDFVEDENIEVRLQGIRTLPKFSEVNPEFTNQIANVLGQLLTDGENHVELDSVQNGLLSLCKINLKSCLAALYEHIETGYKLDGDVDVNENEKLLKKKISQKTILFIEKSIMQNIFNLKWTDEIEGIIKQKTIELLSKSSYEDFHHLIFILKRLRTYANRDRELMEEVLERGGLKELSTNFDLNRDSNSLKKLLMVMRYLAIPLYKKQVITNDKYMIFLTKDILSKYDELDDYLRHDVLKSIASMGHYSSREVGRNSIQMIYNLMLKYLPLPPTDSLEPRINFELLEGFLIIFNQVGKKIPDEMFTVCGFGRSMPLNDECRNKKDDFIERLKYITRKCRFELDELYHSYDGNFEDTPEARKKRYMRSKFKRQVQNVLTCSSKLLQIPPLYITTGLQYSWAKPRYQNLRGDNEGLRRYDNRSHYNTGSYGTYGSGVNYNNRRRFNNFNNRGGNYYNRGGNFSRNYQNNQNNFNHRDRYQQHSQYKQQSQFKQQSDNRKPNFDNRPIEKRDYQPQDDRRSYKQDEQPRVMNEDRKPILDLNRSYPPNTQRLQQYSPRYDDRKGVQNSSQRIPKGNQRNYQTTQNQNYERKEYQPRPSYENTSRRDYVLNEKPPRDYDKRSSYDDYQNDQRKRKITNEQDYPDSKRRKFNEPDSKRRKYNEERTTHYQQPRSRESGQYQSRSGDDRQYQSRSGDDKLYQSRSGDDRQYQSRSGDDRRYQSRSGDVSRKDQSQSRGSSQYQSQSRNRNEYQNYDDQKTKENRNDSSYNKQPYYQNYNSNTSIQNYSTQKRSYDDRKNYVDDRKRNNEDGRNNDDRGRNNEGKRNYDERSRRDVNYQTGSSIQHDNKGYSNYDNQQYRDRGNNQNKNKGFSQQSSGYSQQRNYSQEKQGGNYYRR